MKYKLIVFDWDGTLMDSVEHIVASLASTIGALSLPYRDEESLKNIIGLSMNEALSQLFPDRREDQHKEFILQYRTFFFQKDKDKSKLFKGVRATVDSLKNKGHLLAVATGKGRHGLDKVLTQTGMAAYFHCTRCGEETNSKPNPLMLSEIMSELQVDARDTVMVGDTEYDMEMAVNANVTPIAVNYGVHAQHRLLKYQPLACLESIQEIMGII